jgi:AmiR/NasT family two-component response regulator
MIVIAGALISQGSRSACSARRCRPALARRDVIGQAKGILMERYRLTPDAAFALLDRISQETSTKLHDVADQLTRTGGLPEAGHRRPAAGLLS